MFVKVVINEIHFILCPEGVKSLWRASWKWPHGGCTHILDTDATGVRSVMWALNLLWVVLIERVVSSPAQTPQEKTDSNTFINLAKVICTVSDKLGLCLRPLKGQ